MNFDLTLWKIKNAPRFITRIKYNSCDSCTHVDCCSFSNQYCLYCRELADTVKENTGYNFLEPDNSAYDCLCENFNLKGCDEMKTEKNENMCESCIHGTVCKHRPFYETYLFMDDFKNNIFELSCKLYKGEKHEQIK